MYKLILLFFLIQPNILGEIREYRKHNIALICHKDGRAKNIRWDLFDAGMEPIEQLDASHITIARWIVDDPTEEEIKKSLELLSHSKSIKIMIPDAVMRLD